MNENKKWQTTHWRFSTLLLSGIVVILGAVVLMLLWQMHGPQISPGNAPLRIPTTRASDSQSASPQAHGTPSMWPKTYKDAVKQEIAAELNLSVAQIKNKISQPQVSLFRVTTEQGIQQDQVIPLWLNALRDAGNLLFKMGTWTRQQADTYWQYWSDHQHSASGQKNIDIELSRWFTEG